MKNIIIVFAVLLLISCEKREWNNPFDPACPKESWIPQDFKAEMGVHLVMVSWKKPSELVYDYRLTRIVEDGVETELQVPAVGAGEVVRFMDTNIIGGKLHRYKLTAVAGVNVNNTLTCEITPAVYPTVTTADSSSVTATSILAGGEVKSDGGATVSDRGICWSTSKQPTITDQKIYIGGGTGTYSATIGSLQPATTYYFRSFAVNSQGISYGNVVRMTTLTNLAVLSLIAAGVQNTLPSKSIYYTYNISSPGGPLLSTGVCWSYTPNPTVEDNKSVLSINGATYSYYIFDINPGETYHIRGYAINTRGISYSNELTVTVPN